MTELEHLTKLIESAMYWGADTPEKIAERLIADGDVIVPPCKVGDTVYRVCKKRYDVDGYGMQWEEDWGVVTNRFHLGMLHEIKKNVFLTREEAEAVLAEKIKASKQLKNVIN